MVGTRGEDAALASVRSFDGGSASHWGGGHDRCELFSVLCSLGSRGLSQPVWWLVEQVRALIWPLFARSSSAEPPTLVVVSTTGEGAALASFFFFGVGAYSH